MEQRPSLYELMRRRGVSEEISYRVERLNPAPDDGQILRGIHYKRMERPYADVIGRGEAIERFGREKAEAAQKLGAIKRGRRVWIAHRALVEVGAI